MTTAYIYATTQEQITTAVSKIKEMKWDAGMSCIDPQPRPSLHYRDRPIFHQVISAALTRTKSVIVVPNFTVLASTTYLLNVLFTDLKHIAFYSLADGQSTDTPEGRICCAFQVASRRKYLAASSQISAAQTSAAAAVASVVTDAATTRFADLAAIFASTDTPSTTFQSLFS